jgi:hypothetical protein
MNTAHKHVWCPTRRGLRPLCILEPQCGHDTRRFISASDPVCDACGFAVATLYSVKSGIEALQRNA